MNGAEELRGARMKLQRAEEHWGQLLNEHQLFLARNPYRMLREHDTARGENYYLWRAKVVEEPPYEKWASLVGECAHALRSALDHTAYALVNTPTFVTEGSGFPILDDQSKWSGRHPRDLPGVGADALALIERLQPYQRGPEFQTDPLWVVHRLDIIDKHRRLFLVNTTLVGTVWRAIRGELSESEGGIGPFADGAVVGRFKLVPRPPDPELAMSTTFNFGIAMARDEPGEGQHAIRLLEELRSYMAA